MALEKYDVEDFYSGGLIAAERALSSGFLSVLDPTYDEVQLIKISGDPDTEIIYGNKAWSDVNGILQEDYFMSSMTNFMIPLSLEVKDLIWRSLIMVRKLILNGSLVAFVGKYLW